MNIAPRLHAAGLQALDASPELRLHRRFIAAMKVLVLVEARDMWEPHAFWTANVSAGGILVVSEDPTRALSMSSRLIVHVFLDEDRPITSIALETEIVHNRRPGEYGLRIVERNGDSLEDFEKLLSRYVERHPDCLQRSA